MIIVLYVYSLDSINVMVLFKTVNDYVCTENGHQSAGLKRSAWIKTGKIASFTDLYDMPDWSRLYDSLSINDLLIFLTE